MGDSNLLGYTKLDKEIDKYLGTTNLRPGPPKRLVNKLINGEKVIKVKTDKKTRINFTGYSLEIKTKLNWEE
jgi:hypothetical protein